jgi:hypothetical protein
MIERGRPRSKVPGMALLLAVAMSLAIGVGAYLLQAGHRPRPFPASDYEGLPSIGSRNLLIGTNYTHFAFPDCSWDRTGILGYYDEGDARNEVHRQLGVMRRDGIQSLRTIVWHLTDASHELWGPVPSAGGRLAQPYRGILIDYLSEVRRYGFARLTLSFAPMWTNDPSMPNYDPAKFSENWHFIEDVRSLAKRYGPADVRFDLLNEGAPSDYLPPRIVHQITSYLRRMYSRYVRAFGKSDVTVSAIPANGVRDRGNRLQNLIAIFASTGLGQPRWFELHVDTGPRQALYALRNSISVLRRNRLEQPIVIGEAPYDDPGISSVFRPFMRVPGPIREILEWTKKPHTRCNVSPPYRADAYRASRQS